MEEVIIEYLGFNQEKFGNYFFGKRFAMTKILLKKTKTISFNFNQNHF